MKSFLEDFIYMFWRVQMGQEQEARVRWSETFVPLTLLLQPIRYRFLFSFLVLAFPSCEMKSFAFFFWFLSGCHTREFSEPFLLISQSLVNFELFFSISIRKHFDIVLELEKVELWEWKFVTFYGKFENFHLFVLKFT